MIHDSIACSDHSPNSRAVFDFSGGRKAIMMTLLRESNVPRAAPAPHSLANRESSVTNVSFDLLVFGCETNPMTMESKQPKWSVNAKQFTPEMKGFIYANEGSK